LPANGIDNLAYTYATNSNKLLNVFDNSNNTSGFNDVSRTEDDYTYDANGNMITDKNKNITAITYNHLNLPAKITFGTTGNIVYLYNAVGQKVKKIFNLLLPTPTVVTTDYLGGYQYTGGVLQFYPTAEGYVKNTAGVYSYVFNYTDHLGNVRLSYTKNTDGSLAIIDENNYYPFGLKHKVYNDYTPTSNKYKFQGQERQDELGLNWDSFKWRNYDYTIGRFMNVDPLAEKYSYQSPYNFSENRVIDARELEGLEAIRINYYNGTSAIRTANYTKTEQRDATISALMVYPIATAQVRADEYGGLNISSVSGRIARHMTDNGNMTGGIGSESNAFRHALWSGTMANQFGNETATDIANAHEGVGPFDTLSIDFNSSLVQNNDYADSVVDILNNEIGRGIGKNMSEGG
jgi:RHS repeat-associated protein